MSDTTESDEESEATNDREVSQRIKELGEKATQLLLFLTFALLAAVTLETNQTGSGQHSAFAPGQMSALSWAIRLWVAALFPILLTVLPVKELFRRLGCNLTRVRCYKVVLLWIAIIAVIAGAVSFFCAVW